MSVFIHDRVHGAAPGLKMKPLLELDSVINRSHTPVKYMYRHMKSPPTFLYLCGCVLSVYVHLYGYNQFVPIVPGVPYQVRVRAASLGGFGSPAIENCFSRQLGE